MRRRAKSLEELGTKTRVRAGPHALLYGSMVLLHRDEWHAPVDARPPFFRPLRSRLARSALAPRFRDPTFLGAEILADFPAVPPDSFCTEVRVVQSHPFCTVS